MTLYLGRSNMSKSTKLLQGSNSRLQDGSSSSSGSEPVKATTYEPDIPLPTASNNRTASRSFPPSEITGSTTSSPSTSFPEGTDHETTDSRSNSVMTMPVSTVSPPMSTSTFTEIDTEIDQSLSCSVSPWGTSIFSGFDYETEQVTGDAAALNTITNLESTHSLLTSSINISIQRSAVATSPFDDIPTHFATAADGAKRDPALSNLYPITSTAASLQQPAPTSIAMTSMQDSQVTSGSFSLVPADHVSAVRVSAVDVGKSLSQTTNPSSPTGYDPTMYNTSASRTISRKSLGATLGVVSGAGLIFAIVYLSKRFNQIYPVKVQAKTQSDDFIEDELDSLGLHSIYRQDEKEISRFSIDS